MTVNTTNITSGPYVGNGVSASFSYTFRVESDTQLSVYEKTTGGVQTLLTLGTDYTVAGVGVDGGGTITRVAGALPSGYEWYIRSNYGESQLTAFPSQGPFFPAVHEDAFDKVTFLIQQLSDKVGRSLKLTDSDSSAETVDMDLPLAAARASNILAFDNTGAPVMLTTASYTPDDIPAYYFVGDGVTTQFSVAGTTATSPTQFIVDIDGVTQHANTYSVIAGPTIQFTTAPPNLSAIQVRAIGTSVALGTAASQNVSYTPTFVGSVASDVRTKLQESVSVKDFGAVGDGVTDDTAAIQAAIANGGVIEFVNGETYNISTAGLSLTSLTDVHLVGNGATLSIQGISVLPMAVGLGFVSIFFDTCANCSISGFKINGNNFATNALGMETCTDCSIENNEVYASGSLGQVVVSASDRLSVKGNYVHTPSTLGAFPMGLRIGNSNVGYEVTDSIIAENIVIGSIALIGADGIVGNMQKCKVINNRVSNTGGSGIVVGGANANPSIHTVISGNIVSGCLWHGIQHDSAAATTADLPRQITVSDNIVFNNQKTGIYANHAYEWIIDGNLCIDNSDLNPGVSVGINVSRSIGCVVSNNVCYDTRVGAARTQLAGILAQTPIVTEPISDLTITGNLCKNHTGPGISIATSGTGTYDNVMVNGNNCPVNSTYGIYSAGAGASNIAIINNQALGNTTFDIRADVLSLSFEGNRYGTVQNADFFSFTDLDATPSVLGGRKVFKCINTVATNVTNFTNGVSGQEITVNFTTANTTIIHGATIKLNGSANQLMTAGSTMTLRNIGGVWYEVARMVA